MEVRGVPAPGPQSPDGDLSAQEDAALAKDGEAAHTASSLPLQLDRCDRRSVRAGTAGPAHEQRDAEDGKEERRTPQPAHQVAAASLKAAAGTRLRAESGKGTRPRPKPFIR